MLKWHHIECHKGMRVLKKLLVGSVCVLGVAAWADGPSGGSEVTSTHMPLISTQELEDFAQRCSQETSSLLEGRHGVSREGYKDFSIALGVASQDCMQIQKVVEWLRTGTKLKAHYDRYLAMAKEKMGASSDGDALGAVSVGGGHTYDDEAITAKPLEDISSAPLVD